MKSIITEQLKELWESSNEETRNAMAASGKEAVELFTKSKIRQDDFVMLMSLCAIHLNQVKPEDITNKMYKAISSIVLSAYTIGNRRGKGKTDDLGFIKPNKKKLRKKKNKKEFTTLE